MDKFIGAIRTENALTARLVRQTCTVDFQDCAAVVQAVLTVADGWYEFIDCPLTLLAPGLAPKQAELLQAWETLQNVSSPNAELVRLLQSETVLGQPPQRVLPPIPTDTLNVRVKPTAAHPRAHQGTKYKPPKPKTAAARDWRPYLCDPQSIGIEAGLPEGFRVSLYPLVRQQSDAEVAEMLALYWALSLESNPERLAAVAFSFCLQNNQNTRDWCRLITHQAQEYWTILLHLLIVSGADTADCQHLPPSFREHLAEVLNGKDPFYRAYWLLHGIEYQIDPAYFLAGFRLADVFTQAYDFHSVQRSGYFPRQTIYRWGAHCIGTDDFYAGTLLHLWEQCGLRPGLGECLEKTDWTQFSPEVASRCLRLFRGSWDNWGDLSAAEADAKWEGVCPLVGAIVPLLQEILPEYQKKCVWHLIEYLWQWDSPKDLQANLPSAFALTRRLCHSPFAEKNDPTEVTTDFLAHSPSPLRERFLQAPDMSFKRLEQACRRDNDSALIGRGTRALIQHQADFTMRCFEHDPVRLFKAAKLLGSLSAPRRDAVVCAFTLGADENTRLGLETLEQAVIQELQQGFRVEGRDPAEKHALQMQPCAKDNRRGLRKFLNAHWEGQTDYRQKHPLTQRWLGAHPDLALEVWLTGITYQAASETFGPVTLTVEQNPLEALKLGTYVGSCLGLGGAFAYSAAAVVLDINKQVVYARTARGTVVGRQLVAVSEENQLVCYEVYPLNAQKDLGPAFAEFD